MAAFITAMIPDLTLLHFRNTTEAGQHPVPVIKVCTVNCVGRVLRHAGCGELRHQRVLVGVRLQQIAGRDKKSISNPL